MVFWSECAPAPVRASSEEGEPRAANNWRRNAVAGVCSFPRRMRLHLNREFQRVYHEGKRRHGQGFSLIFAPNGSGDEAGRRLGISVRKKTGNAVRRNRIKRLFREFFRLHQARFPGASDIVITVRPGFVCDSLAALDAAMTPVLRRQVSA